VANEHELALARQFFDGNAGAGATFALPQHFPPAEVLRMEEMNRRGIGLNEAWGADHQDSRVLSLNGSWANEFGNTTQISPASSSVQHSAISQSERALTVCRLLIQETHVYSKSNAGLPTYPPVY